MRNNKGFGKFEVLTVIVVMMAIFCFLAYTFLGGVSNRKLDAMKASADTFSNTVATNIASFHNTENVYLQEVLDEKLISKIKNPISGGYCSSTESFVQIIDGTPYVTLKCGNVLIDKTNTLDDNANIYKVSDWSLKKKNDSDEKRVLYNCTIDSKEVFEEYYDELYFIYEVNKKYDTNYYFADKVEESTCKVVTKEFYRTKKKLED